MPIEYQEDNEIAYTMQRAYNMNSNRENACIEVRQKHPEADPVVLRAMWDAIDDYVDMFDA